MDELTIDGKTYVSSKRAAAITGYAKDYVGQLCREGRVEARLVGRSWYVYEPSIRAHRFEEQGEEVSVAPDQNNADEPIESVEKEQEEESIPSEKTNVQAVWETPTYQVEESIELPLAEQEMHSNGSKEVTEDTVEEIEDAWQSWFKGDHPIQTEAPIYKEQEETIQHDVQEAEKEIPVHVIRPQEERRVEYVDMPRQQERTNTEAVYTPPAAYQKPLEVKKPKTTKNYLALRAVLIGIMIIASALAFLGSGFIKAVPQDIVRDLSFIQYFEGISSVEKTVE